MLFYPTAIGSEPHDAPLDTRDPWRRVMQGHAVANVIPVVAANRIGFEPGAPAAARPSMAPASSPTIAAIWISALERTDEGVITATFDLDFLKTHPRRWVFPRSPDGSLLLIALHNRAGVKA